VEGVLKTIFKSGYKTMWKLLRTGWDDEKRNRWFSWFLAGPAKATWQQTMSVEHKTDWSKIAKVYCGQYGIHLDPRTAYQCCHELQYEQFGSVQGSSQPAQ